MGLNIVMEQIRTKEYGAAGGFDMDFRGTHALLSGSKSFPSGCCVVRSRAKPADVEASCAHYGIAAQLTNFFAKHALDFSGLKNVGVIEPSHVDKLSEIFSEPVRTDV